VECRKLKKLLEEQILAAEIMAPLPNIVNVVISAVSLWNV
jgi:hypothetical protein